MAYFSRPGREKVLQYVALPELGRVGGKLGVNFNSTDLLGRLFLGSPRIMALELGRKKTDGIGYFGSPMSKPSKSSGMNWT